MVLDVYSRRVVRWSIADHLRTELVADAIDMPRLRRNPAGTIAHSITEPKLRSTDGMGGRCLRSGDLHCRAVGMGYLLSLPSASCAPVGPFRRVGQVVAVSGGLYPIMLRHSASQVFVQGQWVGRCSIGRRHGRARRAGTVDSDVSACDRIRCREAVRHSRRRWHARAAAGARARGCRGATLLSAEGWLLGAECLVRNTSRGRHLVSLTYLYWAAAGANSYSVAQSNRVQFLFPVAGWLR